MARATSTGASLDLALEHRRERLAGAAPVGPEVDDDGQLVRALEDVAVEGLFGDVHADRHVTDGAALGGAALGDGLEALADLGRILAEIVEPRQLGESFEAEDPLEQLRRAVTDRAAETRLTTRLDDEPALDEPGDHRVGCDTANAGDIGPRARAQVGDDGERLERCLREAALDGSLDEACAGSCFARAARKA